MPSVWIAVYSIRKALREKVFYLIPLVTIVALALVQNLKFFEHGVRVKVLVDFGMTAVSLFGFLVSVVLTISLVPSEREGRTLTFLLSKPVSAGHFVTGKFLAITCLLALNLAVVGAELLVLARAYSAAWDLNILKGLYLVFVKLVLFSAVVLLLATMLSLVLTVFCAALAYAVMAAPALAASSVTSGAPAAFRELVQGLVALIPDLTHFDTGHVVVHGYPIPAGYLALVSLYAATWIGLCLLAATAVLERGDA
jgi:ABC-type transport system involved in multi-copper enzyme maturation permease subunit